MNFPGGWARLPGPADFLQTLIDLMVEGNSVIVVLPPEAPPDDWLAVEVADRIARESGLRWESAPSADEGAATPREIMAAQMDRAGAADLVLWVNATGSDSQGSAWVEQARRFSRQKSAPRICLAVGADRAPGGTASGLEVNLRVCSWSDFVTATDSRVLSERHARKFERTAEHVALKNALVEALARADLAAAETLTQLRVAQMLDSRHHPPERIWRAQIAILLPIVEHERRRYLKNHRNLWRVPHRRGDGITVEQVDDLEIGDLVRQARDSGMRREEIRRLEWLRRVRNDLAHVKIVRWETLTSPEGLEVADFRE